MWFFLLYSRHWGISIVVFACHRSSKDSQQNNNMVGLFFFFFLVSSVLMLSKRNIIFFFPPHPATGCTRVAAVWAQKRISFSKCRHLARGCFGCQQLKWINDAPSSNIWCGRVWSNMTFHSSWLTGRCLRKREICFGFFLLLFLARS